MSNEWKDRVIRGGFVTIATVAAVGCVSALIAVTMGTPAALRAGSAILALAAGIGLLSVAAVIFPSRPRTGIRRHRGDT